MNYFNYFSEIEELFVRRRGRNLLLSPLDWALIESWQERQVPLHIILRGIERVFDSVDQQPPSARRRTVKSLLYCKEEIEAQYHEWLERQVGKKVASPKSEAANPKSSESNSFSDEMIAAHLARVSAEVKSARDSNADDDLRKTFGEVLNRLSRLERQPQTAEQLEEALEKLDALVDESLLRAFETEKLKPDVEREIAAYKNKMEPEVYERTFDLMLRKQLRERAGVPRLSLFYL